MALILWLCAAGLFAGCSRQGGVEIGARLDTAAIRGMNMYTAVRLLVGFNYVLIVSLPVVFFEKRDRRHSLMWWTTAAPFILLPGFVVLAASGLMPAFSSPGSLAERSAVVVAIVSATVSIALVLSALATHRVRLPQWHQDDDLPTALVTHGPYSKVRHPFYSAYLLMFLAAAALAPNVGTIGAMIYAAVMLNLTAAREERRLHASHLGGDYRSYAARTGRFLPTLLR